MLNLMQVTKLETQVGEATAAGKAAAMEEGRQALQPVIEQLKRDKAEALELYSQENRKRKLVHNKLLELQGNIRVSHDLFIIDMCMHRRPPPSNEQTGWVTHESK